VARAELETVTGRRILDVLRVDVDDLNSVRHAITRLDGDIAPLVMNAGVIGPQTMLDEREVRPGLVAGPESAARRRTGGQDRVGPHAAVNAATAIGRTA
jgi:hypothetical protein